MAKILEGTFSSFDDGFEIYYLMQCLLNMRYSWDNQKKGQNNKKLGSASLRLIARTACIEGRHRLRPFGRG